jgi:hypothetical protein
MLKKRPFRYVIASICLAIAGFLYVQGCGSSSSSTEDSSTSGTVAAVLGGSYNNSGSGGTVTLNEIIKRTPMSTIFEALSPIQNAVAGTACPTYASTSNCTSASDVMTLTYGTCSFSGSAAVWSGAQVLTLTGSTTVPCGGTSPVPSGFGGTLTRTFTDPTTRTAASGTVVQVSNTADSVFTTAYSSAPTVTLPTGGIAISFTSGSRSGITINGVNLIAGTSAGVAKFNHSLTSSLVGLSGTNLTNGATVTVYHNLLKIKATATLNNVAFSSGCCTPTSGSISTAFTAVSGVTPTVAGSLFVGNSETLTFTGCGTATYTGPEGYSGNVTLAHCI